MLAAERCHASKSRTLWWQNQLACIHRNPFHPCKAHTTETKTITEGGTILERDSEFTQVEQKFNITSTAFWFSKMSARAAGTGFIHRAKVRGRAREGSPRTRVLVI